MVLSYKAVILRPSCFSASHLTVTPRAVLVTVLVDSWLHGACLCGCGCSSCESFFTVLGVCVRACVRVVIECVGVWVRACCVLVCVGVWVLPM